MINQISINDDKLVFDYDTKNVFGDSRDLAYYLHAFPTAIPSLEEELKKKNEAYPEKEPLVIRAVGWLMTSRFTDDDLRDIDNVGVRAEQKVNKKRVEQFKEECEANGWKGGFVPVLTKTVNGELKYYAPLDDRHRIYAAVLSEDCEALPAILIGSLDGNEPSQVQSALNSLNLNNAPLGERGTTEDIIATVINLIEKGEIPRDREEIRKFLAEVDWFNPKKDISYETRVVNEIYGMSSKNGLNLSKHESEWRKWIEENKIPVDLVWNIQSHTAGLLFNHILPHMIQRKNPNDVLNIVIFSNSKTCRTAAKNIESFVKSLNKQYDTMFDAVAQHLTVCENENHKQWTFKNYKNKKCPYKIIGVCPSGNVSHSDARENGYLIPINEFITSYDLFDGLEERNTLPPELLCDLEE